MAEHLFIEPNDLADLLGSALMPDVIDVCLEEDHALDPRVVPTARRVPFAEAAEDTTLGQDRPCVILCQKGLKLSQGVAAVLRSRDAQAQVLRGGMVEWTAQDQPAWRCDLHPALGEPGQRWCLPSRPGPRDILNIWTITRFVDPQAQSLQVEPEQCAAICARFDAFDAAFAEELRGYEGPLRFRFAQIAKVLGAGPLKGMLEAHCAGPHFSATWAKDIYPALDAIWATCEGQQT